MPSCTALVAFYAFSVVSGLMIMEVNINTVCALGSGGVSTQSMVKRTLGSSGAYVSAAAFIFLHYCLLVAAISKAASLMTDGSGQPLALTAAAFSAATGAFCVLASPKVCSTQPCFQTCLTHATMPSVALASIQAPKMNTAVLRARCQHLMLFDASQAPAMSDRQQFVVNIHSRFELMLLKGSHRNAL